LLLASGEDGEGLQRDKADLVTFDAASVRTFLSSKASVQSVLSLFRCWRYGAFGVAKDSPALGVVAALVMVDDVLT
jgi:hypothetical protein